MSKVVEVDWPDETYDRLERWAQQTGRTVNGLIRQILNVKLDELESRDENEEGQDSP